MSGINLTNNKDKEDTNKLEIRTPVNDVNTERPFWFDLILVPLPSASLTATRKASDIAPDFLTLSNKWINGNFSYDEGRFIKSQWDNKNERRTPQSFYHSWGNDSMLIFYHKVGTDLNNYNCR